MFETGLRLLAGGAEETAQAAERTFTVPGPLVSFTFDLFGYTVKVTETVVIQWFVIAVLGILFFILGRNLKVVPDTKRQAAAEWIVTWFTGAVEDSMGKKYVKAYAPYLGALFCFVLLNCLTGLFGLKNPSSDISVTGAWAVITFVLVFYNKIKTGGMKGYLKSYVEPMPFMLPFNIIGDFANPVAQALRLFGNNVSGIVIGGLVYFALGGIAGGLAQIGVPAVLSLYFDLFSAVIQSYIFITLTMAYVSMAETD